MLPCVTRFVQTYCFNINYCMNIIPMYYLIYCLSQHQARQTRPNSGGVAEGHPRFDKGGVVIIFYFLRVKNRTFLEFLR